MLFPRVIFRKIQIVCGLFPVLEEHMEHLLRLITASLMLTLLSCGGDGGGEEPPFFAGVWSGYLNLVENNCGLELEPYLGFVHLVNQVGTRVVIDNGAYAFAGTVSGPASFSAMMERASAAFGPNESCTENITWRYEAVSEKNNTADFVVRISEMTCLSEHHVDEARCRFVFSGTGYRVSHDDTSSPRPVPMPVLDSGVVNEAVL